jgi:hypothetical protein
LEVCLNNKKGPWIPEIVYSEDSTIPFIEIPENQDDPGILYIFLNRRTGEIEPGSDGEEIPVMEMDLRQFVDLSRLKSGLSEDEYNKVRRVLGLEDLKTATEKGKKLTDKIRSNLGSE